MSDRSSVNLLPWREQRAAQQKRRWAWRAAGALAGMGVFILACHALLAYRTHREMQTAAHIQTQLAGFSARPQTARSLQDAIGALRRHARYRQTARRVNARLMKALQTIMQPPAQITVTYIARRLPPSLLAERLPAKRRPAEGASAKPPSVALPAASQLTVGGKCQDSAAVYRWLRTLQRHPAIRQVRLETIQKTGENAAGHFVLELLV